MFRYSAFSYGAHVSDVTEYTALVSYYQLYRETNLFTETPYRSARHSAHECNVLYNTAGIENIRMKNAKISLYNSYLRTIKIIKMKEFKEVAYDREK
jgi:hypothetical protein